MRTETKHAILLLGATGTTASLSLVYAIYVGNVLGPVGYADFTAAVSLIVLLYVALGPINGTVAHFTAKYASASEYGKIRGLSRGMLRGVAMYGLLGLAVGVATMRPVAAFLRFDSVWPLAVSYFVAYLLLLLSVPRGVLRGLQAFPKYTVNTISEAMIRLAVGVMLLHWVCSAASGLSAYVVGLVAVLLVSWAQLAGVWAGRPAQAVDAGVVRRFTVPMLVFMITVAGHQNIDMLFVKHAFASTNAGCYGAAFTLARTISVLVTPFTTMLLPMITSLHEQGRPIAGVVTRVSAYFLVLAVLPLLCFFLFSDWIVLRLYGSEFAAAAPLLLPVTVLRLVGSLCHLFALVCVATGSFRFLYVYVPALLVQGPALLIWHASPASVVVALIIVQAFAVVGVFVFLIHRARFSASAT